MMRRLRSLPPARDGGFILVAVLWIVIALATFATVYATYVIRSADTVGTSDEQVNAQALFTSALELTAYHLTAPANRMHGGEFSFRMNQASVRVEYRSEAARVDLNAASKELLSNLFVELGAPQASADDDADRVIAWRSFAGADAADDSEAEAYRAAGLNYGPRRAPFQDPRELWLVLGLPPALVEHALPYVTVFSGSPQVNVLDAAPIVLAALPGMTADGLESVLAARRSGDQDIAALLAMTGGAATTPGDANRTFRVTVGAVFDNGVRAGAEIVVLLTDDGDAPYRILAWRDDFDGVEPAGN